MLGTPWDTANGHSMRVPVGSASNGLCLHLTSGREMQTIREMSTEPPPEAAIQGPDYDLADNLLVSDAIHLKALGDDTRRTVLDLLHDRAATTTQIAEVLGRPKGTVGYHLKVLETAGLVKVVRTRQVRAITEKYYGRTARTFVISGNYTDTDFPMLIEALGEARIHDESGALPMFTLRHVRIPEARALEFADRLAKLSDEFVSQPREGDVVYGLIAGVYPTDHPRLPSPPDVFRDAGPDDPTRGHEE